ncbi:MAG TPA: tetratricopeptide repeat protein [Gemmatimonadaceae bacterium]
MTRTGASARPPVAPDREADSLVEWAQLNSRAIVIGVVVLLLAIAGWWLYRTNREARVAQAETALARAGQSLATNNVPLAITDLQRVVDGFSGTPAAREAALLLAQLHYGQGEHQKGVEVLQRAADQAEGDGLGAPVHVLIADGQMELQQYEEAARSYLRAAELSPFAMEQANDSASAARAFTAAKNVEAATAIWRALAEDEDSPVRGEAKIRLGELTALAVVPAT